MNTENRISKAKNILLALSLNQSVETEINYLKENFCGSVISEFPQVLETDKHKSIYLCGNLENLSEGISGAYIIEELSDNYDQLLSNNGKITLGKVPIVIHNAGVYYRNMFEGDDYFHTIQSEHEFQELTESNKDSKALRKGIYLTDISKEETEEKGEILHYRLLRCSSNLTGPTDNFRAADHDIVNTLNTAVSSVFEEKTKLNHVLAQIYTNSKNEKGKETKAKIKAHSDKTKDMPAEGLIAFCTFYNDENLEQLKPSKADRYDLCYKQTSGLTRLHFKLKNDVSDESLSKEFSVTLYPNSAFLIPLSTNRLYTHAIKPSTLNIDKIPVRMGYVARCSNLEAMYMNEQAFIKENDEILKLEQMTEETMADLRNTYYQENSTEERVKYGKIRFSMNSGDYEKPIY